MCRRGCAKAPACEQMVFKMACKMTPKCCKIHPGTTFYEKNCKFRKVSSPQGKPSFSMKYRHFYAPLYRNSRFFRVPKNSFKNRQQNNLQMSSPSSPLPPHGVPRVSRGVQNVFQNPSQNYEKGNSVFWHFSDVTKTHKKHKQYRKLQNTKKITKNMAPALMEKIAIVASFRGQDRKSLYGISQKIRLLTAPKRPDKLALVLFKDHVAVRAASQAEYTYARTQTTKYNMLHKTAKRKSALRIRIVCHSGMC